MGAQGDIELILNATRSQLNSPSGIHEQVATSGAGAFAGLRNLAQRIDDLGDRIDKLEERHDVLVDDGVDIHTELADLRRKVAKLKKAAKKSRK